MGNGADGLDSVLDEHGGPPSHKLPIRTNVERWLALSCWNGSGPAVFG